MSIRSKRHIRTTLALILGIIVIGLSISLAFFYVLLSTYNPNQSHMLQHAYRYGCIEGNTEKTLDQCNEMSTEYRQGLEIFLLQAGLRLDP